MSSPTDRHPRASRTVHAWAVCLAALAFGAQAGPARELSLTIDDLPWAHHANEARDDVARSHAALLAAMRDSGVEAVGFVNVDQLEPGSLGSALGTRMLAEWLADGHELGNHTWGHLDLHAVGIPAFQAGVIAGESHLRSLVDASGGDLRWFRHPYLRTGTSREQRAAIEAFLDRRGYRVAPVTVDNSDWIYALAYRRLHSETRDEARLADFRRGYVDYLLAKLRYYEQQALDLLGTPLPQVLLHANRLNAEAMPELLDRIRADGWIFVRLEEALAHPAYARADGYLGRYGPSWIHRWAIAEGKGRAFFGDEPRVPAEILELAGVESE